MWNCLDYRTQFYAQPLGPTSGQTQGFAGLHVYVERPFAALRRDPDNVLCRILDIAGLAVYAVLGVDLQSRVAAVRLAQNLIYAGRAVPLLGRVVERKIHADR